MTITSEGHENRLAYALGLFTVIKRIPCQQNPEIHIDCLIDDKMTKIKTHFISKWWKSLKLRPYYRLFVVVLLCINELKFIQPYFCWQKASAGVLWRQNMPKYKGIMEIKWCLEIVYRKPSHKEWKYLSYSRSLLFKRNMEEQEWNQKQDKTKCVCNVWTTFTQLLRQTSYLSKHLYTTRDLGPKIA